MKLTDKRKLIYIYFNMLIGPYHIITYKNRKNETLIRDSECFFLFQLYNESVPAIGEVKEKVFGLGLQLIRFPLFRWQKQPIYIFKTANHLPKMARK